MSDAIYDNVNKNESERLEMMVAIYESVDCVRDHDFRTETNTHQPLQSTGSDSVKIRNYRSTVVCLVLLCVLLLTAVIVLCVYNYTNYTNYTQERDELLTNITSLTDERNQLLTNNTNLIQLKKFLIQDKNKLLKCLDEIDGWFYYKSSCYYISSEKNNWTESRRYCTERGADLIIINNREEQEIVMKKTVISEFWIGLTDSDVEGTWKWVDGSNMTSGFWIYGEPNGGTAENCVVTDSSRWYYYMMNDRSCNYVSKWICEKKILK